MKSILKKLDIRYVEQPALYGKPDFLIKDTKVLVFCDSAFWHGKTLRKKGNLRFGRNKGLWLEKLIRNMARDKIVTRRLRKEGWRVIRFWDSDILHAEYKIIARIQKSLKLT